MKHFDRHWMLCVAISLMGALVAVPPVLALNDASASQPPALTPGQTDLAALQGVKLGAAEVNGVWRIVPVDSAGKPVTMNLNTPEGKAVAEEFFAPRGRGFKDQAAAQAKVQARQAKLTARVTQVSTTLNPPAATQTPTRTEPEPRPQTTQNGGSHRADDPKVKEAAQRLRAVRNGTDPGVVKVTEALTTVTGDISALRGTPQLTVRPRTLADGSFRYYIGDEFGRPIQEVVPQLKNTKLAAARNRMAAPTEYATPEAANQALAKIQAQQKAMLTRAETAAGRLRGQLSEPYDPARPTATRRVGTIERAAGNKLRAVWEKAGGPEVVSTRNMRGNSSTRMQNSAFGEGPNAKLSAQGAPEAVPEPAAGRGWLRSTARAVRPGRAPGMAGVEARGSTWGTMAGGLWTVPVTAVSSTMVEQYRHDGNINFGQAVKQTFTGDGLRGLAWGTAGGLGAMALTSAMLPVNPIIGVPLKIAAGIAGAGIGAHFGTGGSAKDMDWNRFWATTAISTPMMVASMYLGPIGWIAGPILANYAANHIYDNWGKIKGWFTGRGSAVASLTAAPSSTPSPAPSPSTGGPGAGTPLPAITASTVQGGPEAAYTDMQGPSSPHKHNGTRSMDDRTRGLNYDDVIGSASVN